MIRTLSIFGATGSVGTSTLDLVRRNRDTWQIVALTAHSDAAGLARLAREFGAQIAVIGDAALLHDLRMALDGSGIDAAAGPDALVDAALRSADVTMAAIVGCAGLAPTMAALTCDKTVALANKESLVSAGSLMIAAAKASGAIILPVDSEHNAIFQCLAGDSLDHVAKITLTASGGPFRTFTAEQMRSVTPAQAVAHPNWSMGAKISVDSATMMNKGLELIEAHHLFPVGLDRIDIVVHPQSVVHSLVSYRDGSTLAQMGPPDMRVPIASALAWPARMETPCAQLDLASIGSLTFEAPDPVRFPAIRLARAAIAEGGGRPAQMNAANEVAVAAFLDGRIGFTQITEVVEGVMNDEAPPQLEGLQLVYSIDQASRTLATKWIEKLS
jgi:1-deoxy-D-xylulose-5-phosphate reductoisomerase